MMDMLSQWLEASSFPLISAFILGLMTAIAPCPLATNISATAAPMPELPPVMRTFAVVKFRLLGVLVF